MKFGECLKAVFDGHYEDLSSDNASSTEENTRFTYKKMFAAFENVPWKWKSFVYQEFLQMAHRLREQILKCPHEKYKLIFEGCRECEQCKSKQRLVLEDQDPNSYNERKIWSSWEVL